MPLPKSVFFVASQAYGGGRIRSYGPAEALAQRGWQARAGLVYPPPGRHDRVVIHRPLGIERAAAVRHLKAGGSGWVAVDEDDDLEHVQETKNEIAKEHWTAEKREQHDQAIREADALIVTSDALRELYGSLCSGEIFLIPNAPPSWIRRGAFYRSRRDNAIRVGWAGIVLTHRHDLEWIAPFG